jgi:hypothetical protein
VDTRKKIKELIEELNYRTDNKSSEEIYRLSRELFELSILEHRGASVENITPESIPEPLPQTPNPSTTKEAEEVEENTLQEEVAEPEVEEKIEEVADEKFETYSTSEDIAEPREIEAIEEPASEETPSTTSHKSLNDVLGKTLNIGFNDRFAFVNKLFDGNQDDYNRVISQLNTMKSFVEARNFIESIVKPDYNWNDSEEYEVRFMEILERHFD